MTGQAHVPELSLAYCSRALPGCWVIGRTQSLSPGGLCGPPRRNRGGCEPSSMPCDIRRRRGEGERIVGQYMTAIPFIDSVGKRVMAMDAMVVSEGGGGREREGI